MTKVKIIGAGSIGNHLANAARKKGWDVTICDNDLDALTRMKHEIYPQRYGSFDKEIKLFHVNDVPRGQFDWIFIGTPPDTHISLAITSLKEKPTGILIEKPLSGPDLNDCDKLVLSAKEKGIKVFVGYDHVVAKSTGNFLKEAKKLKNINSLDVYFREHWGGIFNAHPWLSGPEDSYLGFYKKGGGALGEHSHALNLWQFLANEIGLGKVTKVSANLDYIKTDTLHYDRLAMLHLETEKGFLGSVVQDVLQKPALKFARIQSENEALEWQCLQDPYRDVVRKIDKEYNEKIFKKIRADDFVSELNHLEDAIKSKDKSPISIEAGLDTMLVIAAAHKSAITGKIVCIDYNKGYNINSLSL